MGGGEQEEGRGGCFERAREEEECPGGQCRLYGGEQEEVAGGVDRGCRGGGDHGHAKPVQCL